MIPTHYAVFDENNPDLGVKAIHLTTDPIFKFKIMETEKKQSGYQKLKAENEELKQRIEALKEQLAKYEPAPDMGEAVA